MDNENVITKLLDSKIREYNRHEDSDNFSIPNELTVTITLDEYRRLVTSDARHSFEIDEKQKKINKLVVEKEQLKNQQEVLLKKIAEGSASDTNTEEQPKEE